MIVYVCAVPEVLGMDAPIISTHLRKVLTRWNQKYPWMKPIIIWDYWMWWLSVRWLPGGKLVKTLDLTSEDADVDVLEFVRCIDEQYWRSYEGRTSQSRIILSSKGKQTKGSSVCPGN